MMEPLRRALLTIENSLDELIYERGAKDDYPELEEIRDVAHNLRVNSKIASTMAFDKIERSEQFVLATDNGDKISVCGHSCDEFDLELAFGIINKARKIYDKERLYCLFLKVMDGDFDD